MAGIYRPRHPEKTVLYRVLFHYFEKFISEYEHRFEKEYGYFRPVIQEVVEKYIDCGNPKNGFARIRCPDCQAEYLLTFSCKTRQFCPSCHAKRIEEWGEWMREKLLLDVLHRQVVFVIPKMLRIFFKYKRPLQGALCRCGVRALLNYFKTLTGTELTPGIIAVIQTFGQRINFHPHLHFLITDGGADKEGTFHKVTPFDDPVIAQFFSQEVFSLLLQKELINPALVEKMLLWKHSGFSVHSKVRAMTKKEAEKVGKYMIRPLLSLERLRFEQKQGLVSYRYGKQHLQEEKMDYLEFIARVTSHIPDKGQVMIRYYGLYANAHRGKKRLSEKDKAGLLIMEEKVRRRPRKGWAEMIQKVYEVDPLLCPRCQGQMKIIAFVRDYTVVDRIIHHLDLHFMAERPPPLSEHVLFSSFTTGMNSEKMTVDG